MITQRVPEGFQRRLLEQLVERIPEHPVLPASPASPASPTRRRRLVLAAAGAATVLAAGGIAVGAGGGSPAWAVETRPDGSVVVSIFDDIAKPEGLQRDLRRAGVPAVVWVDRGLACDLWQRRLPESDRAVQMNNDRRAGPGFRVFPRAIGAGHTLFILIHRQFESDSDLHKVGLNLGVIAGDQPDCRPLPTHR